MIPFITDYTIALWQLITGQRQAAELRIATNRQRDIQKHLNQTGALRILDLANGRLQPQYLILKSQGHDVVGIDWINRPGLDLERLGYRFARWLYRRGLPTNKFSTVQKLVCGDVGKLPFPSNYFDLITSIAAFEHFMDVPAVVAECARVLRPNGIAYFGIHPFTCPSGGHNIKLMEIPLIKLPTGVQAWDHLRQQTLPYHVPLNEWRISDYLTAVSRHFRVWNSYCAMREGEHLVTPEIEIELSEYSRDELTCGAYVIVAGKL